MQMFRKKSIVTIDEKTVSLSKKVSFLKQPAIYPHPVNKVETRETHMSWVFLANDHVYKLKKPVKYRFLDFRTLDARLKNCREEIRLNKRLAPDIYIGIVPLTMNKEGQLKLGDKGQAVEWLVRMKRIPEENLLNYAIAHKQVNKNLIENAANLLAAFYVHARPVATSATFYCRRLSDEIKSTHAELMQSIYHISPKTLTRIKDELLQFLTAQSSLFGKRTISGKIIEAHGDLKPEHICLRPQPAIIDALEFSRPLRVMDVAEELAFLDMECEMLGDTTAGQLFFECYIQLSSDIIPVPLIHFYKAKKAFLRAYLVARHITEPKYKGQSKWLTKANSYLRLALRYSEKLCG